MTPEEKTDAERRGYIVLHVSATTNSWWQVYLNGHLLDDCQFGTEDEGWQHAINMILRDQYNH
ncbi:hypothetical protein ACXR0M_03865 [Pseudomonas sp. Eth.TT006]